MARSEAAPQSSYDLLLGTPGVHGHDLAGDPRMGEKPIEDGQLGAAGLSSVMGEVQTDLTNVIYAIKKAIKRTNFERAGVVSAERMQPERDSKLRVVREPSY